jgi:WD40 repeat protein
MRKSATTLCLLVVLGTLPERAPAQSAPRDDRLRNLATELIVETGARTAACDVLLFTPDGKNLLAAGDDKVVRVWPFSEKTGIDRAGGRALRWSIFREQRGSIYALALDPKTRSVAIGGFGLRPGAVAVLDWSGEVKAGVTAAQTSPEANGLRSIWSMAFSPSGRQVAYGGVDGSVWVWIPGRGGPRRLGTHPGREGKKSNEVRLVVFTAEDELLSVASDGWVCAWDPGRAGAPARRFQFGVTNLAGAAIDPGKRWLAAFGQDRNARLIEVRSLDGRRSKRMLTPDGGDARNYPRCLAFDRKGEHLAVGYYTIPGGATFYKISGGGVAVYDLTQNEPRASPGPASTYYPEALAFHPQGQLLAVAGGENHEVTVWDLKRPGQPFSRVAGPGRCLWGVGVSEDMKLLGFQDQRTRNPAHPNDWGGGDWKVFDLKRRGFATPEQAQQFKPVKPLRTKGGWSVVPDRLDGYVWNVRNPDGQLQKLPLDRGRDGMPRCYTFLEGNPVRLVVGHYWGASVFELGRGEPRLVRKFVGHQGEVMAVAPSADGKLLLTASRDQTISCWRLTDWPNQRELGAKFVLKGKRLVLDALEPGSPAWEARLRKGDEVVLLAVGGRKVFDAEGSKKYGPAVGKPGDCLPQLEAPVPGKELYFGVRRAGEAGMVELLTTVRQRPVWRFFPTEDSEWVLWRYHDFYYDTSTNGDFHIGWQLSGEVNTRPAFDRAEQFRKRFYRPDKVAALLRDVAVAPERISPLDIEPPRVALQTDRVRVTDEPVRVSLTIHGRASLEVGKVSLWVNDHLVEEWTVDDRSVEKEVVVPNRLLRRGKNLLTVQGFNRAEARRDAGVEVECIRRDALPDLYTLAIGVGDYKKAGLPSLSAGRDAEAIGIAWKAQEGLLFRRAHHRVLRDGDATRERVIEEIRRIGKTASADDILVLFLGGHGTSDEGISKELARRSVRLLEPIGERTFVFCPYDFDLRKPVGTGITGTLIYQELRKLACRKVVLLDACHSGTLTIDPVREMAPAAVGPLVYSACAPNQLATESKLLGLQFAQGRANGVFAIALLLVLEDEFDVADRDANNKLNASELLGYLKKRVPSLLHRVAPGDRQDPVAFLPPRELQFNVAAR